MVVVGEVTWNGVFVGTKMGRPYSVTYAQKMVAERSSSLLNAGLAVARFKTGC